MMMIISLNLLPANVHITTPSLLALIYPTKSLECKLRMLHEIIMYKFLQKHSL